MRTRPLPRTRLSYIFVGPLSSAVTRVLVAQDLCQEVATFATSAGHPVAEFDDICAGFCAFSFFPQRFVDQIGCSGLSSDTTVDYQDPGR